MTPHETVRHVVHLGVECQERRTKGHLGFGHQVRNCGGLVMGQLEDHHSQAL